MDEIIDLALTDPVANRLGYLMRRASSIMMAELGEKLARLGLRPVEATILTLAGANSGCTQSDIGRILSIKRANMVPLIGGMLEKALLEKVRVDGRSFALSPTDHGERVRLQALAIMDDHEAGFEALMDDRTKQDLFRFLDRVIETRNSGSRGSGHTATK
ncbi:MAG: MarR family winged helix-turn-helix transcriptional regulator [Sphingobium sp.]